MKKVLLKALDAYIDNLELVMTCDSGVISSEHEKDPALLDTIKEAKYVRNRVRSFSNNRFKTKR